MCTNMKRLLTYITLPLLLVSTTVFAQNTTSPLDSVDLGNLFRLQANGNPAMSESIFEKSPEVDIANALYGQLSGLLVKNGSSVYDSNQSKLSWPSACTATALSYWWTVFHVHWTTSMVSRSTRLKSSRTLSLPPSTA